MNAEDPQVQVQRREGTDRGMARHAGPLAPTVASTGASAAAPHGPDGEPRPTTLPPLSLHSGRAPPQPTGSGRTTSPSSAHPRPGPSRTVGGWAEAPMWTEGRLLLRRLTIHGGAHRSGSPSVSPARRGAEGGEVSSPPVPRLKAEHFEEAEAEAERDDAAARHDGPALGYDEATGQRLYCRWDVPVSGLVTGTAEEARDGQEFLFATVLRDSPPLWAHPMCPLSAAVTGRGPARPAPYAQALQRSWRASYLFARYGTRSPMVVAGPHEVAEARRRIDKAARPVLPRGKQRRAEQQQRVLAPALAQWFTALERMKRSQRREGDAHEAPLVSAEDLALVSHALWSSLLAPAVPGWAVAACVVEQLHTLVGPGPAAAVTKAAALMDQASSPCLVRSLSSAFATSLAKITRTLSQSLSTKVMAYAPVIPTLDHARALSRLLPAACVTFDLDGPQTPLPPRGLRGPGPEVGSPTGGQHLGSYSALRSGAFYASQTASQELFSGALTPPHGSLASPPQEHPSLPVGEASGLFQRAASVSSQREVTQRQWTAVLLEFFDVAAETVLDCELEALLASVEANVPVIALLRSEVPADVPADATSQDGGVAVDGAQEGGHSDAESDTSVEGFAKLQQLASPLLMELSGALVAGLLTPPPGTGGLVSGRPQGPSWGWVLPSDLFVDASKAVAGHRREERKARAAQRSADAQLRRLQNEAVSIDDGDDDDGLLADDEGADDGLSPPRGGAPNAADVVGSHTVGGVRVVFPASVSAALEAQAAEAQAQGCFTVSADVVAPHVTTLLHTVAAAFEHELRLVGRQSEQLLSAQVEFEEARQQYRERLREEASRSCRLMSAKSPRSHTTRSPTARSLSPSGRSPIAKPVIPDIPMETSPSDPYSPMVASDIDDTFPRRPPSSAADSGLGGGDSDGDLDDDGVSEEVEAALTRRMTEQLSEDSFADERLPPVLALLHSRPIDTFAAAVVLDSAVTRAVVEDVNFGAATVTRGGHTMKLVRLPADGAMATDAPDGSVTNARAATPGGVGALQSMQLAASAATDAAAVVRREVAAGGSLHGTRAARATSASSALSSDTERPKHRALSFADVALGPADDVRSASSRGSSAAAAPPRPPPRAASFGHAADRPTAQMGGLLDALEGMVTAQREEVQSRQSQRGRPPRPASSNVAGEPSPDEKTDAGGAAEPTVSPIPADDTDVDWAPQQRPPGTTVDVQPAVAAATASTPQEAPPLSARADPAAVTAPSFYDELAAKRRATDALRRDPRTPWFYCLDYGTEKDLLASADAVPMRDTMAIAAAVRKDGSVPALPPIGTATASGLPGPAFPAALLDPGAHGAHVVSGLVNHDALFARPKGRAAALLAAKAVPMITAGPHAGEIQQQQQQQQPRASLPPITEGAVKLPGVEELPPRVRRELAGFDKDDIRAANGAVVQYSDQWCTAAVECSVLELVHLLCDECENSVRGAVLFGSLPPAHGPDPAKHPRGSVVGVPQARRKSSVASLVRTGTTQRGSGTFHASSALSPAPDLGLAGSVPPRKRSLADGPQHEERLARMMAPPGGTRDPTLEDPRPQPRGATTGHHRPAHSPGRGMLRMNLRLFDRPASDDDTASDASSADDDDPTAGGPIHRAVRRRPAKETRQQRLDRLQQSPAASAVAPRRYSFDIFVSAAPALDALVRRLAFRGGGVALLRRLVLLLRAYFTSHGADDSRRAVCPDTGHVTLQVSIAGTIGDSVAVDRALLSSSSITVSNAAKPKGRPRDATTAGAHLEAEAARMQAKQTRVPPFSRQAELLALIRTTAPPDVPLVIPRPLGGLQFSGTSAASRAQPDAHIPVAVAQLGEFPARPLKGPPAKTLRESTPAPGDEEVRQNADLADQVLARTALPPSSPQEGEKLPVRARAGSAAERRRLIVKQKGVKGAGGLDTSALSPMDLLLSRQALAAGAPIDRVLTEEQRGRSPAGKHSAPLPPRPVVGNPERLRCPRLPGLPDDFTGDFRRPGATAEAAFVARLRSTARSKTPDAEGTARVRSRLQEYASQQRLPRPRRLEDDGRVGAEDAASAAEFTATTIDRVLAEGRNVVAAAGTTLCADP